MRRPKYRLSPNEVERLVKEETEQRRKLRIVQVREQAKASAAAIRNDVRREKTRLLKSLASEIEGQLEAEKEEKVRKLEEKYEHTLRAIGDGHKEAKLRGDGESRAEKLQQERENALAAEERFQAAILRERKEEEERDLRENAHIYARQAALEMEKERATKIASLPPPPPDISVEVDRVNKRSIPMVDMKAFATTHYHIPDYQVVKATEEEKMHDGKAEGADSDLRLQQDLKERKRSQHEQIERARIRGNQALQKEMLKHDLGDMLQDLSLLQRQDRKRRQTKLAEVPNQVFIPPEHCMEERLEREREMEKQFDQIYFQQYRMEPSDPGSLEEVSDHSTTLQDQTGTLKDLTNQAEQDWGVKKKPETVLKQLLNKIKEQRESAAAIRAATTSSSKVVPGATTDTKASAMPIYDQLGREAEPLETDRSSAPSGESRAQWEKSEEEGEGSELQDSIQAGHGIDLPVQQRSEAKAEGQAPKVKDMGEDSRGDSDDVIITRNDQMIVELQRRIEMIEAQKAQIWQKGYLLDLHSRESPDTGYHKPGQQAPSNLEKPQRPSTDQWPELGGPTTTQQPKAHMVPVLPSDGFTSKELSSAASKLKHVAGILKGSRNAEFELMASNGFLPSPQLEDVTLPGSDSPQVKDAGDQRQIHLSGNLRAPQASNMKPDGDVMQADLLSNLNQEQFASKNFEKDLPGTSLFLKSGAFKSAAGLSEAEGKGGTELQSFRSFTRSPLDSSRSEELARKVHEYQATAGSRQAGVDEETLRKVRDYQNRLLHSENQRKKLLSEVRSDLERRREELHQSSLATMKRVGHLAAAVTGETSAEIPLAKDMSEGKETRPSGFSHEAELSAFSSGNIVESRAWQPIQPFVADRGKTDLKQLTNAQTLRALLASLPKSEIADKLQMGSRYEAQPNEDRVEPERVVVRSPTAVESGGTDKIRKSLTFSEPSMTPGSWADVLNDSCSQGTPEDSRLSTSHTAEDRGSPLLHTSSSWDKGNNSVTTGSSSLNGSALVARAEQCQAGFERRQEELQFQLMDIQRQKDSIMERYYSGQQQLQQQQLALRSKLAMAKQDKVAPGGQEQRDELRAKLAEVKSQLGELESMARQRDSDESSTSPVLEDDYHPDPLGTTAGSDRRSLDSKKDSSADSYLDEISFQGLRSAGQLTDVVTTSSGPGLTTQKDGGKDGQMTTWRAILSGQNEPLHDRPNLPPSNVGPPPPGDQGSAPILQTWGLFNRGLEHQPHELSTILEVDTPSSSTTKGARRKPAGAALTTTSTSSLSSTEASRSIGIEDLGQPYTFPKGGAALAEGARYNLGQDLLLPRKDNPPPILSLASLLRPSSKEHEEATLKSPRGAKRTLDFSKDPASTQEPQEQKPEEIWSPRNRMTSPEDEDLSLTQMPPLVENTPLKPAPGSEIEDERGAESAGELSSFSITGYSSYLRDLEENNTSTGNFPREETAASSYEVTELQPDLPSMTLESVSLSADDLED